VFLENEIPEKVTKVAIVRSCLLHIAHMQPYTHIMTVMKNVTENKPNHELDTNLHVQHDEITTRPKFSISTYLSQRVCLSNTAWCVHVKYKSFSPSYIQVNFDIADSQCLFPGTLRLLTSTYLLS